MERSPVLRVLDIDLEIAQRGIPISAQATYRRALGGVKSSGWASANQPSTGESGVIHETQEHNYCSSTSLIRAALPKRDNNMQLKSVFLLSGESGSYEDTYNWPVAVFTTRKQADEFKAVCERKAKASYEDVVIRQQAEEERRRIGVVGEYPEPYHFPEDPDGEIDYNTAYSISVLRINPKTERGS